MQLNLRYDMNSPAWAAPHPAMYRTAIEQAAWADKLGFTQVFLAEHHGAEDGYCPSPMVQAASIFGATKRINVHLSALVVTLHDPLRLAEDLAVLDNISNGRIWLTVGMGYRPHEFEMFGKDATKKLALQSRALDVFKQAWTGEPFEFEGRTVRVTPKPVQPGGPKIYMGGSTEKSALRAARGGYQYFPGHPGLFDIYAAERAGYGFPPPEPLVRSGASFLYISDDPDRDWPRVAPHVAYATNLYAEWATERGSGDTLYKAADSAGDVVGALKAMPNIKVLTADQCFDWLKTQPTNTGINFHPLLGGLDPELSWASLLRFENQLLPRLIDAGMVDLNI